ncbi:hypothetical protein BC827DRAFT_737371 [Russula dissimulans]|nr:hypothetical protein BC827DRAFT_737371 [Russula dissimulans]
MGHGSFALLPNGYGWSGVQQVVPTRVGGLEFLNMKYPRTRLIHGPPSRSRIRLGYSPHRSLECDSEIVRSSVGLSFPAGRRRGWQSTRLWRNARVLPKTGPRVFVASHSTPGQPLRPLWFSSSIDLPINHCPFRKDQLCLGRGAPCQEVLRRLLQNRLRLPQPLQVSPQTPFPTATRVLPLKPLPRVAKMRNSRRNLPQRS